MINLIPYDHKKQLSAAKMNSSLLRYNIILLTAAVFLCFALGVVYVFLMNMQTSAKQTIVDNQSREQSYTEIKTKVTEFQTELSNVKVILSNDISYSKALIRYGNLFPEGTAISSLKLSEDSFSTPTSLSVKLTGQEAAQSLISSMQNSQYVKDFQRRSISVSDDEAYPYTMEVSFTLTKDIAK